MEKDLAPERANATRFAGKVCIVTGAGQGIGLAVARRLGAEGGAIVVAERVEETGRNATQQLLDGGIDAMEVIADLSFHSECARVAQETVDRFGRIDVLVNCVGGTIWWQPFHEYSVEQVQLELERSLSPTLWCCLAILPLMVEQKFGTIVNLSSSVTRGGLYRAPYAVAKGGVEALTKVLANEYGRYGIRVNAAAPGSTAVRDRVTPRLLIRPGEIATAAEGTQERLEEARDLGALAIARQSTPEEQAATIAFLASDDASYITGQVVSCSGSP